MSRNITKYVKKIHDFVKNPKSGEYLNVTNVTTLQVNNASYQMNLRKRFLKGGAVYRADLRIFFGMVVSMASCIMERV